MGRYENLTRESADLRAQIVYLSSAAVDTPRPVLERLANAAAAAAVLEDLIGCLVAQAQLESKSWEQIGGILQISRQAAHKKWAAYAATAGVPRTTDTGKTVTE